MPLNRQESLERFLLLPPHNDYLGIQLCHTENLDVETRLPIRTDFLSDANSGQLHGGVISSFLDASCSIAVMKALPTFCRIATLDLRIDYLKPCYAMTELRSRSRCTKLTKQIGFSEGLAYELDGKGKEIIVAKAACTFMLLRARATEEKVSV